MVNRLIGLTSSQRGSFRADPPQAGLRQTVPFSLRTGTSPVPTFKGQRREPPSLFVFFACVGTALVAVRGYVADGGTLSLAPDKVSGSVRLRRTTTQIYQSFTRIRHPLLVGPVSEIAWASIIEVKSIGYRYSGPLDTFRHSTLPSKGVFSGNPCNINDKCPVGHF